MVTLHDGSEIPIEQVRRGSRVKTGPDRHDFDEVIDIEVRKTDQLLTFQCRPLTGGPLQSLTLTREHQIWVDGVGWRMASALKPGDWVSDRTGNPLAISSIKTKAWSGTVYSFENRANRAFYANGILVHDSCEPPGRKTARQEVSK